MANELPKPNQSRTESYLGVIAGQDGAEKPEKPLSRVEEYLNYIAEHGGGGGGTGIKCGVLTNGDHFPTARPTGDPLANGDWVGISNTSTFPFSIDGVTFNSSRDTGVYQEGSWRAESGTAQDTDETPLSNPATESFYGDRTTQNQVNADVVTYYKDLFAGTTYTDLDTLEETDILNRVYHQTEDTTERTAGYYIYDFTSHEWNKFGAGDIPNGDTLPSGKYDGELFILNTDISEAGGVIRKGLYMFNGSVWKLKATANKIELVDNFDSITTPDKDSIYILQNDITHSVTETDAANVVKHKYTRGSVNPSYTNVIIKVSFISNDEIFHQIRLDGYNIYYDELMVCEETVFIDDAYKTIDFGNISQSHSNVPELKRNDFFIKEEVEVIDYEKGVYIYGGSDFIFFDNKVISTKDIYLDNPLESIKDEKTQKQHNINTRDKFISIDNQLVLKQDKTDDTLQTSSKQVIGAINENKERIDAIEIKPDVVDIVQCYDRGLDDTKTDIVHYDISKLFVGDAVKVLTDETHSELASYYKVVESGGSKSFVYSASEADIKVDNISIGKNASGQLEVKSKINNKPLSGGDIVLDADDIKAKNTQTIQQNLERIDDDVAERQVVIEIDSYPESLTEAFLYRVDEPFTHSGITFVKGFYQVIDDELSLIAPAKDVKVDNASIDLNGDGELEVKGQGITIEKISPDMIATTIGSSSTDNEVPTAKSVYDSIVAGRSVDFEIKVASSFLVLESGAYHIGGDLYYIYATLQLKSNIPANTETLVADSIVVNGKRLGTYGPLIGSKTGNSSICSAVIYPYATITQLYLNCPSSLTGGEWVAFSGVCKFD